MRYKQYVYRVGKAPRAFGLGRDMGGSLPAARGWVGTLRRTAGSHHVQAVPTNMECFVTVRSIVVEVAVDVSMGGCSGDR
jgi:hypothetical protein